MNRSLLTNYLTITIRQALRDKLSAIISIVGLGLGIAATLIIADYVGYEKSFDTLHSNYERIYRVTTAWNVHETPDDVRATTVQWSGPGVKALFPEVENFTRVMPVSRMTGDNAVHYGNTTLNGPDIILADPGFLTMFSFKLIDGDVNTALSEPRSVVITESVARKYFNNEDPIGKALVIGTHDNLNGDDFRITGVISDAPANSHFRYDFIVSYSSMWKGLDDGSTYWHWDNTYCYLLLHPNTDVEGLGRKMTSQRVQLFGSEMGGWNDKIDFHLQPLSDIHLFSSLKGEIGINANGRYLYFLIILAACILLCACINYINLSVARAIKRQTEIGIRKVTGSTRMQLMTQLGIETLLVVSISVVFALVAIQVTVPLLETMFNIPWHGLWAGSVTPATFLMISGVLLLMLVVSMLYPASVISSVKPATVLKATRFPGSHGWSTRRYLIVAQFFFCIVFTVGTWLLFSQLNFIREHDPGFEREQVLVVRSYGFQKYTSYQSFRQSLINQDGIVAVGKSSAAPGDEVIDLALRPKISLAGTTASHEVKLIQADEGFFDVLNVGFVTGRAFNESIPTDKESVIINEATAKILGFIHPADALMKPINGLLEKQAIVIGVVKNYNQRSFKTPFEPIVFMAPWRGDYGWNKDYYFVKLKATTSEDYQDLTNKIELAWKASAPSMPFSHFYLDDHFEKQYQADRAFIGLFTMFSGFAVFITLAGLSAVVATVAAQRTREIGIRKVFGATLQNILTLLSMDFVKLMTFAALLAIPMVVIAGREWLNTFAFRINLRAELFIWPAAGLFSVVLLIVLFRSAKAAITNPVDSLRHE